ncbi:tRNA lysidine(34) synthetase TilS [Chlamydia muridarum str. Nigg]|jgi:tRNA(Ile)-lysidine synthetase, N-terminal domain|uniref:tRNA(Ile)-lysidine synthase n=2 Tax=Chlamydia muridarum TaxID=83560 RepID=TILS_CHLMU|nr:tRNA lysidine(34) synthetase TilS [Chlamydia muridarum]Q9PL79.1 RecName: Full=tRNA(Ile)-lysidine synthase; AltName: Full=tRNA(Ile)-2-lysyl-cytidine synthase; AltName: Full=tRNA(Ile)-lysidine synthetase [Chlamydia muridarum str. Nigg]UFX31622.1 tRNA lysidine(34) synthetase TilS [Chlamydia trachomatis]AAF39100.1 MesJ/Ycf62 family protein [Chlamydia muridarum str. Nigg]AHH22619.1 tRNA(Ile)-lysidine synthetase [Chlamydia muridarum str. Nigg3 CMUT3-5]AHH23543.1 tRNA(Ile)-lysidine synthetase [Chl
MVIRLFENDKQLEVFFSSLDKKKKYLLALSGGSDSLLLMYLLRSRGISFTAVHVDYGWRETSYQEACDLASLCEREQIPFILDRQEVANPMDFSDIENIARQYRYELFYRLCKERLFAGVFLGHHADDQAETILKRVFEGAHLGNLKGMARYGTYKGITLLRPLLHITKRQIVEALDNYRIEYVQDATNADERFLRARMREQLFPYLQEIFGKNIRQPLLFLAEDSAELREYLDQQAAPFLSQVIDNEIGQFLPVGQELLQTAFLTKWVCKQFFFKQGLVASKGFLQTVYDHLVRRSEARLRLRNRTVLVKARGVIIESIY